MQNIRLTVAVLVVLAAAQAHAADRITLTSGRTIEGVLIQESEDRVQFELDGTPVWIERRHMKSLTRGKPAPVGEAERPAAAEPEPEAAPAPAAPDADVKRLARQLESPKAEVRAAAAKAVIAAWPASAAALDAVLEGKNTTGRIEAVRLLVREELGDTQARVRRSLRDASADVRLLAARTARHRGFRGLEPELVKLMRSDAEWKVRQEALRALEVVGSRRCLQSLVAQLSIDEDPAHARRYRRVLEKLLGDDHGDDVDAWRESVERVLYAGGKLASER